MTFNELMMSLEIGLIYGIVAIGIYLTFRIIDFPDLTCDGSFILGSAVSAILVKSNCNPWLSLIAALCAGGIAGITTGFLYTRFKVTNLLAGILVSFMLYSINLHIMGGIPNLTLFNNSTIFSQPPLIVLILISLMISGIITYIFMTDFGLGLRSIGQNQKLAQNMGVNIESMTISGLALSNGLISLGGALFSQHQGFADIGSGVGTVIVGLSSVMIGERLLSCKSMLTQIFCCLLGSITYRLFISVALHSDILGLATQDLNLITGLMVIAIMSIPQRKLC
jgi:putative ABC transport system permease protein